MTTCSIWSRRSRSAAASASMAPACVVEEPRRDRGLLEDLVVEAHGRAGAVPSTRTGSRPANGIAPASASASATIDAGWIE